MKIETVLLSLIKVHPDVTGYQLASIIKESTGHISGIYLSKIYPALKRMAKNGYLTFRTEPARGRLDLKFYTITSEGEAALDELLRKPFEFGPSRNASFEDFMMKLVCMGATGNEEIVAHIDRGIAFIEDELAADTMRTKDSPLSTFMTALDTAEKERHLALWAKIQSQLRAENEERLKWLQAMRAYYADEADVQQSK